jgi:hypothetical protein
VNGKTAFSAIGVAGSLLVAGCQSGGTVSGAHASQIASAKASGKAVAHAEASALATDPAILKDETTFLKQKMTPCVDSATHGALTIGVNTTGQAAIPGTTTPPTITVTHWDARVLFRPFHKFDNALHCAVPKGTYPAAKDCAKHLSLPTSKADIIVYIEGLTGCAVGAPQ